MADLPSTLPAAPAARSRRAQDLLTFAVTVAAVVFLNFLAAQLFFRLDLTADKRYSIAPATRQVLRKLPDVVYVEVYLEGQFPPGFKRLQNAIRETLEEFRATAGANIEYKFVDPSANPDAGSRNEFYQQLAKLGLQPTNLVAMEDGKRVEKIIFPGAVVRYGEKSESVLLLKGNQSLPAEVRLNQSIEGVEYELVAAIRRLTQVRRRRIAFTEGHGELPVAEVADAMGSLQRYYDVTRLDLNAATVTATTLDTALAALVIARPTVPFGSRAQYALDQFVMRGGKVLFALDGVRAELDSIGPNGTYAFPQESGLAELLFKWGARVNPDLVQDQMSRSIPMVTGIVGNAPQTQLVPWRYFPILNTFSQHPAVRNLDVVTGTFISSVDTIASAVGIRKTVLVSTSRFARIRNAPIRLNYNEARAEVNPRAFTQGPLPVAVLLEGRFTSLYQNRIVPTSSLKKTFIEQSPPTRLIVIGDGDILRNEIDKKTQRPRALGFDRFAGVQFANRDLLQNSIDYLLDESDLLTVRTKEVVIRPLDKPRVQAHRTGWQLLNTVVPLVLLGLFGLARFWVRRRKYESR